MKINVEKKLRKIVNGHTEGFSTIELIMVLVIAGVLMAIALPRMTSVSNIDVYTAVRQVQSDIRYTQELAMCKYRQTTITFVSGSNSYTISGITQPRQLPPSSNAKIDATSTALVFTFNSAGEPITGGGGAVVISSGSSSEQVSVSNITGATSI